MTAPLAVPAGALKLTTSLSASVTATVPLTTPLDALGLPTVAVPATGTVFVGLIVTLTGMELAAPYLSLTVTVNVSVLSPARAPVRAAAWRAAAVGV